MPLRVKEGKRDSCKRLRRLRFATRQLEVDGAGIAARFQHPRGRDFAGRPSRLVEGGRNSRARNRETGRLGGRQGMRLVENAARAPIGRAIRRAAAHDRVGLVLVGIGDQQVHAVQGRRQSRLS